MEEEEKQEAEISSASSFESRDEEMKEADAEALRELNIAQSTQLLKAQELAARRDTMHKINLALVDDVNHLTDQQNFVTENVLSSRSSESPKQSV